MTTLDDVMRELQSLRIAVGKQDLPLIVSRKVAAEQLNVSERQLRNLVAAGRIMAHPSGISRVELERYARTPQTKLSSGANVRWKSVIEEAQQLREELKLRRKRPGRRPSGAP